MGDGIGATTEPNYMVESYLIETDAYWAESTPSFYPPRTKSEVFSFLHIGDHSQSHQSTRGGDECIGIKYRLCCTKAPFIGDGSHRLYVGRSLESARLAAAGHEGARVVKIETNSDDIEGGGSND